MGKSARKVLFFNLFLIFFLSCSTSPTYSRKEVDEIIEGICQKEYNLNVRAWDIDDTIWIYAPFEYWDENVIENIRRIFLSLRRVILSMDKPPKFYCFVASDIKETGVDVYYMGFVPDMIKLMMEQISLGEFQEREVFINELNPRAIGDKEGNHISKYNITMGEFISYLVWQSMQKKFTAVEVQNNFQIDKLETNYYNGKLYITFDIKVKEFKKGLLNPFEEAKKIVEKFLKIYSFFEDIIEVEIDDTFNKRFYSKEALFD